MERPYQKICFDQYPSFRLHHTAGNRAGEANPAHLHQDSTLILTYFKQGSGNIKIEGRRYDIHPGDLILLNPGEMHCCTVNNDQYHERIALYIEESILAPFSCDPAPFFAAFYQRKPGCGNLIPGNTVSAHGIDRLLEEILSLCQHPTAVSPTLAICRIVELLNRLNTATAPTQPLENVPTAVHPTVQKAMQYLNAHYDEPLSLDEVANACYVSKHHLCRLFKECVGTTPWSYVIFRRIASFHRLVQEEHLTLEQACYRVGFNNYSNFYRLYKKHTGNVPAELKKVDK